MATLIRALILILLQCCASDGLLFIPQDEVSVSNIEWVVHLDLHTEEIKYAIIEVNKQFKQYSMFNDRISSVNDDSNFKSVYKEYYNSLKLDLSLIDKEFAHLKGTSDNQRKNRALIDMLGYGLHYIAGTATDEQIKELSDQMSLLEERTNSKLNERYLFLSNASETLKRHDAMLSQTSQALQMLQEISQVHVRALARTNQSIITFNQVHSSFTALTRHLAQLRYEINVINNKVMLSETGQLTPTLLSPEQLSTIFKNITRMLPPGTNFVGDKLSSIYSLSRVRVQTHRGKLSVVVIIPLSQTGLSFTVYKAQIFPVSTSAENALVLKPDSPFLAVSTQLDSFMLLPEGYAKHCIVGSITVCPPHYPILRSAASSCSIATFLNDTNLIDTNCKPHVALPPFYIYIKGEKPGMWYFSVSESTVLNIVCPNKYYKHYIRDQGSITLPSSCYAHDNANYLPAYHNIVNTELISGNNISIEPLNFSFISAPDMKFVNLANKSDYLGHILSSIQVLDTHNVPTIPLSDLERNVKIIAPLKDSVQTLKYSGLFSLSGIGFLIIAVILFMRFRHSCKRGSRANPEDIVQSVPINIYNNVPQAPPEQFHVVHMPLFPPLQ